MYTSTYTCTYVLTYVRPRGRTRYVPWYVVTEVNLLRELRHHFIVKYCDRILVLWYTCTYVVTRHYNVRTRVPWYARTCRVPFSDQKVVTYTIVRMCTMVPWVLPGRVRTYVLIMLCHNVRTIWYVLPIGTYHGTYQMVPNGTMVHLYIHVYYKYNIISKTT